MYDMKPVRLSRRGSYVRFTDEMEQAMSSQRHLDLLRAPVIVTYGTNETPEFQRQSRDFAAAVRAAGKPVELIEAADYNHFEMVESLGNPYGPERTGGTCADEACTGVTGAARRGYKRSGIQFSARSIPRIDAARKSDGIDFVGNSKISSFPQNPHPTALQGMFIP